MKFCPVVPEICCGQVHVPQRERKKERKRRIRIIIIRNGAKTISLQTLFGRLNYKPHAKTISLQMLFGRLNYKPHAKNYSNPSMFTRKQESVTDGQPLLLYPSPLLRGIITSHMQEIIQIYPCLLKLLNLLLLVYLHVNITIYKFCL